MPDIRPVVFVVDDDPDVRAALRRLIQSVGLDVETFPSAREFLSAKRAQAPGCVILDVRLPDLSGLNLQEQLTGADVDLPIIFITGYGDIPMTVRAMKAGALDFLTKPFRDQELLDAIRRGIDKHRAHLAKRAEVSQLQLRLQTLTPREQQVFQLVAGGWLNKQIAAELGTSEKTIKVHRGQVMAKMKADSVSDLVRMAEKLELAGSSNTAT
jgi:FixJ family two-component response regulator